MGGRKSVFAERVADAGSERLGLGVVSPGSYLVEVSRTNTTELQPVRGRIRLSTLGIRQDLPFSLSGRQVVAATLVIERKWHLELVRGPQPRRYRLSLFSGAAATTGSTDGDPGEGVMR